MVKGYLCIVLHAHLPFIRHPEHEYFLEENWLFEAITETYIPLIEVLTRLLNEKVDFRITMSLSPTLIEMLNDALLRKRYKRHLNLLIELTEKEIYRTKRDIKFQPLAKMYNKKFKKTYILFDEIYKRDLVSVFRKLARTGKIELISSTGTHAFLPILSKYPSAVEAQIKIGTNFYKRIFKINPAGMWFPECGYEPGFDNYVKNEGLKFIFLEAHGVTCANPTPRLSVYVPVVCPSGVFAFGRDKESSQQVWSSIYGYPGDFNYRDFYRDIGYDIEEEHVMRFINLFGTKIYTGLKYYKITGNTDKKEPYVIERALEKAYEHAIDFINKREIQINYLFRTLRIKPIITAMFDAELFGHWWFEGPDWLYFLLKFIDKKGQNFKTITPSEYLTEFGHKVDYLQLCRPSMSSWGHKGFNEVWVNEFNDYIYPHILKATERMIYLAETRFYANGLEQRALNQAARELILSQQSDWPFMMKAGNTSEYAKKRLTEHLSRFNYLYAKIIKGNISKKELKAIEDKDNVFKMMNFRHFKSGTHINDLS